MCFIFLILTLIIFFVCVFLAIIIKISVILCSLLAQQTVCSCKWSASIIQYVHNIPVEQQQYAACVRRQFVA